MRKTSLILGLTLSLPAAASIQENMEKRALAKAWQEYLSVTKKVSKTLTSSPAYKKTLRVQLIL